MAAVFDWNKKHAKAVKLITKFGGAGSLVIKGQDAGVDDRNKPIAAIPDVSIPGIVTPLLEYTKSEIDGESVQVGDSYIFFEADDGSAPVIGMMITIAGVLLRVVSVYRLGSVGGINVFSQLQLRK